MPLVDDLRIHPLLNKDEQPRYLLPGFYLMKPSDAPYPNTPTYCSNYFYDGHYGWDWHLKWEWKPLHGLWTGDVIATQHLGQAHDHVMKNPPERPCIATVCWKLYMSWSTMVIGPSIPLEQPCWHLQLLTVHPLTVDGIDDFIFPDTIGFHHTAGPHRAPCR